MENTDTQKAGLQAFHVMAKPTGAICNLDCAYCFFLSKEKLYPESNFHMEDGVMESYIRQTLEAHNTPQVTIAWQGGEPTLMGLDFFRRAVAVVEKYRKPGTLIEHTIQTNGIQLDEQWCEFLRENNMLVGISIDGPKHMHDVYRRDKGGFPTYDKVLNGLRLMQKMNVEFNILCTVNSINSQHPLEVYRFFRDELGAKYLQFIPIVERINDDGQVMNQQGNKVTDRTVKPLQYGIFLSEIFNEWVHHDVGDVFVQTFDGVLSSWLTGRSPLCIFSRTCGNGVALEHNGDLYSCDHYVEPNYLLGNIMTTPLKELVNGEQQRKFGNDKESSLPGFCRKCDYLFACHGECPKNRILDTPEGEQGLNYLCAGLKHFFKFSDPYMRVLAGLLEKGQTAADIMPILAKRYAGVGRNELCPCGSGNKFKNCHGAAQVA